MKYIIKQTVRNGGKRFIADPTKEVFLNEKQAEEMKDYIQAVPGSEKSKGEPQQTGTVLTSEPPKTLTSTPSEPATSTPPSTPPSTSTPTDPSIPSTDKKEDLKSVQGNDSMRQDVGAGAKPDNLSTKEAKDARPSSNEGAVPVTTGGVRPDIASK
jgi:hypothetical protein